MAKFRFQDKQETTEHGQILGYELWRGRPSLTYVGGIICEDGSRANWFKLDEADTWFSVPGYIHKYGKKVKGFMTCEDGIYKFIADEYNAKDSK